MEGKVLITGGAGYVGAHANKVLSSQGYRTVVLDNLKRGSVEFVKWGEFEKGDVGNTDDLKRIFSRHNFDVVLHFAGYAYVEESVREPSIYWRNNVSSTLTLLNECIRHGIDKFVFSSSCATYGIPKNIPITETHNQNPISPYGTTKLSIEMILEDFSKSYSLDFVSLRYFNAAGADRQCELGEAHDPETHLIPLLIKSVLDPSAVVNIYGNDYPTKDGTCIRDYVHVEDLAEGHRLAIEYLQQGGLSRAFNLSNDEGFSIIEVIESVKRVTGRDPRVKFTRRRSGDPAILVGNSNLARNILGWKPKYSDLDCIVRTAWDWHRRLG